MKLSSSIYKSVEYVPEARTIGRRVLEILRGAGGAAVGGRETEAAENPAEAPEEGNAENSARSDTQSEVSMNEEGGETGLVDVKELEKAAAEAEERGYKKGFNDRIALDREKSIGRLKKEIAQLDLLLRQIGEAKFHAVEQATGSVIALAMALSRRITRCEIRFRPEVMSAAVQNTIRKFVSSGEATVRLNPSDLERFSGEGDSPGNEAVRFIGDSGIEKGGFLLQLESGEVDGRLESVESEMAILLEELYGKGAVR